MKGNCQYKQLSSVPERKRHCPYIACQSFLRSWNTSFPYMASIWEGKQLLPYMVNSTLATGVVVVWWHPIGTACNPQWPLPLHSLSLHTGSAACEQQKQCGGGGVSLLVMHAGSAACKQQGGGRVSPCPADPLALLPPHPRKIPGYGTVGKHCKHLNKKPFLPNSQNYYLTLFIFSNLSNANMS